MFDCSNAATVHTSFYRASAILSVRMSVRLSVSSGIEHLGLVRSSTTVKNFGVVIDERLSFDDQAPSCIKSCYFNLRRLKQTYLFNITLNLMSSIA